MPTILMPTSVPNKRDKAKAFKMRINRPIPIASPEGMGAAEVTSRCQRRVQLTKPAKRLTRATITVYQTEATSGKIKANVGSSSITPPSAK